MTYHVCEKFLVVACDVDGCCNWCPYFYDCNPNLDECECEQKIYH